jgi:hypothetical protein
VVYRDVDGDALVDSWELFTGTQPVARLLQAPGVLLYGAADRVQLRRADVPRELFRVQPPADHDEWTRLEARLTANRRGFRPDDLELMLRQFGGPLLEVSGASLSGYRSLEGGAYRFVLELRPGFAVAGADFLELAGLPPGTYLVTSAGAAGPFRVEPSTAPLVSVSLGGTTLRELEGGRLRLALLNGGLQDVQEATLEVWAAAGGEPPGRIATQSVTLLSQEPTAAVVDWAPPRSGVWALTPVLRLPDGERLTLATLELPVLPAATAATANNVLYLSSGRTTASVAVLALEAVVGLTAYVFWSRWSLAARGAGGGRR